MDLQANKIDVMFGMGPTPARREMVDFSDMLFNNTLTAVCKKGFGPVKTWEQLNDPKVKIVVDVGSNQDQYATRMLPKATISRLDSSGAASMAVQTGRADCQILMVLLAQPLLAKRPDVGSMFVPEPVTTSPTHIGLPKSANKDLENAVNAWLKGDKVPGKEQIDALARTFGVPAGALLGELASTLDPARTKGEHELLAAYRGLNTRQQGALLEVARSMRPKASRK